MRSRQPLAKRPKLHSTIAQHVWVRRSPFAYLLHAILHHQVPILIRQRHRLQRHAHALAHRLRHAQILLPRALIPRVSKVLLKPNLKIERDAFVAGGAQERQRDGAIDAAAQQHGDAQRLRPGLGQTQRAWIQWGPIERGARARAREARCASGARAFRSRIRPAAADVRRRRRRVGARGRDARARKHRPCSYERARGVHGVARWTEGRTLASRASRALASSGRGRRVD